MNDNNARPARVPANAQPSGEYWVLVPQETGEVAVVNATGYHIFQQCDGSRSEEDIAHTAVEAAGADIEHVRHDVATFVAHLKSAGLLAQ
jgi:hypothetical protein